MGSFEDIKRRVVDRVDIVGLVSEHVALKRSGRRWVGLCPFHAEKTPSFTVSPERESFKCFGCGKGGDIFSFVQFRENVDFVEAMRILSDRAGVDFSGFRGETSSGPGRVDLAKINAWAVLFFRERLLDAGLGRSARSYLHDRGISDEIGERFSLGLARGGGKGLRQAALSAGFDLCLLAAADLIRRSDRGENYETFRDRLIFPIRDATNRVVGFGGRTLVDDRAKYINTRQTALFDKGRGLYGIECARESIQQRGHAVVVEGYTDCLAAHQAGFTEVVATLGTAMTESQVDLLRRYTEEIILLFDSDQAGETAADRAIHVAFPRCVRVRLARISDGKDPSDFLLHHGAEEFSDLLNGAVDALEFKWLQTRKRFQADGSSTQQREAILDFLRVVSEAGRTRAVDAIRRGQMVMQVAHLLHMSRSDVEQLMLRVGTKRTTRVAGPGEEDQHSRHRAPRDGEQAAWTHLLEVVLSEPTLLTTCGDIPDVSRIADTQDGHIASIIQALSLKKVDFRMVDVTARCHAPEEVERIVELANRGALRGNCEQTFRLALERIHHAIENEHVERHRDLCMGTPQTSRPSNESMGTLQRGASEHRSYTPRRLIRGRTVD